MTDDMMDAIRVHEAGGPEVLRYERVPIPALQAGEVLVRVHAVGVNPPDRYLRDGMRILPPELRPHVPFPVILGSDISGVVVAVADDVTSFAEGQAVFGLIRFPGALGEAYAEYVAAPASDLALTPVGLDHIHAAALPMAGLTAWQLLVDNGAGMVPPFQGTVHRPVPLDASSRVLVNGAAGGVGHIALQLAKWKGAHVTAIASGRHEAFLRGLGADEVIDYTTVGADEVPEGFDLVVDSVGGPTTGRFLRSVVPGGALYPVFFGPVDPAVAAERDVTVSSTQVQANGGQLARIGELAAAGAVRIAIDGTFPLASAVAAHVRADEGHLQGKIVLTVA
ncbi:NADP-dependent oxidoreductase [Clavibacter sp. Sh2141]|uniref:NADP-dependent oxidoreductase n=1 Tax=Clavibacter sp. Sh2141 TaxID=3395374 RepID=UPI0039BD8625